MILTLILSLVMMAGLFLMLWAEVGFIQEKRLASSAPKEVLAAMPDSKPERFRGQHIVGWVLAVLALLLMLGAIAAGAWDGTRSDFGFRQFFTRFLVMLLALKAFDIGFFDWFLLSSGGINFFGHYYPEVAPVLGPYLFGFNRKSHLIQIVLCIAVSAVFAWICTLL